MISPVKIWRNQKKIATLVGVRGKIVSWTIISVPLSAFADQAPYPVVIVELEDKTRMTGQLVDWSQKDLAAGTKVKAVIRRLVKPDADGVIQYGIKFISIR
jgi:hypothetical protein